MRFQAVAATVAVAIVTGAPVARAQDARATEVLAAARAAIGGKQLDALKTLTVEATVQRNVGDFQARSEIEIAIEAPDKFARTDTPSGGMGISMKSGFAGERAIMPAGAQMLPGGGMMIRIGGASAPAHEGPTPTPEQLEEMGRIAVKNARHEISRLMLGWLAMTHPAVNARFAYAGEAESPDGKAYVIDVTDENGFAARLFIDQSTRLPLMLTYKGRAPRVVTSTRGADAEAARRDAEAHAVQAPPTVDVSLYFDDWREAGGIRFPHVIRRAAEGTTTEEWSIRKVKLNPRLDPKTFAVESR